MKIVKVTFVIVCLTLWICALIEIISGFYIKSIKHSEHIYQYSYMNGYVYDPYVAFRSYFFPSYGSFEQINSESMIITGGSTAIGVGVLDKSKSYFRVLENQMQINDVKGLKRIVNFAVPGYVSNQEAITYKNYVFTSKNPPKAHLSFTGFNDIYFYLFRNLDIGNHEFSYAIDLIFRKGYPDPVKFSDRIRNIVRRSNVFTLLHTKLYKDQNNEPAPIRLASDIFDPNQAKPEPPSQERIESAAKHFLDNCLSTALLAKHRGTKFIVLLQPNFYYGGQLTVVNNEWFDKRDKLQQWINEVGRHKESYDQFYDLVLIGLKEYKNKGYLEYLDYRAILKDAGDVYLDPVHYNEVGSEIVANQMLKDLKRIL